MSKSMAGQEAPIPGPPYPPMVAGLGGKPSVIPDIPIDAVFMALYLTSFVVNIWLFNHNRRKGHFFLPTALLGGFSMARVLTLALRISWATDVTDVQVAIAAMIFLNVGIVIVYILNIVFALRILRAKQPKFGWSRILKYTVPVPAFAGIGIAIVILVTISVVMFYTLDPKTLDDAKWILRGAGLYFLIVTLVPIFLIALAYALPQPEYQETFSHPSMGQKTIVNLAGSLLCVTIAGFKAGVQWSPPRPIDDPAWYDKKPAFYCFIFSLEIIILILYTGLRVDQRFHVPNGSSKRRTYRIDHEEKEEHANASDDLEKQNTDSSI